MYRKLNIEKIIDAIHLISLRINDRFPESGLLKVCNELKALAIISKQNIESVDKPYAYFRLAFYLLILIAGASIFYTFSQLKVDESITTIQNFVTVSEAMINEIAMIGASFYFLYKLEDILKQKIILKALNELRTIAHVIDMHQLTKDPSYMLVERTEHSPTRELTKNDLSRYLDYCSEMLSLTSKVAAIYGNNNRDQMILTTIHDIEILCSSLSGKIWQKIGLNNLQK